MATIHRQLSAYERGWLDLHDDVRPQVISGLVTVDADLSSCQLAERLTHFLENNPQFKRRIVYGPRPVWAEVSHFDLAEHLQETHCSGEVVESGMHEVVNFNRLEPLGERPPWRIQVYRGKMDSGGGQSAIAFSAHHSLTDGLGARRLLEAIVDPPARTVGVPASSSPSSGESEERQRSGGGLRFVLGTTRDFFKRRYRAPFGVQYSAERRVFGIDFPRKKLQAMRSLLGCSLQELVLLIVTRGLSVYCQRQGFVSSLRAIVPMTDILQARRDASTAHHDIGYVELPVAESSISLQLAQIRAGVTSLQRRLVDRTFPRLLRVLEALPSRVRQFASQRWSRNANLLISFLPAGPFQPKIHGHRVTSLYAMPAIAPGQPLALGIVLAREQVHLALIIDPRSVAEPARLAANIQQSFTELSADESQSR